MRASLTLGGSLLLGQERFRAAVGYGGIIANKREGDGGTPAGMLPLRNVLYRSDRLPAPQSSVPVRPLVPSDGWCDDPNHRAYNRAVRLPINAGAEPLWRDNTVYDIVGVLGWNDEPIIPGRGSAIFLHIARLDFAPTQGCIALALNDLRHVLSIGLTEILVTA